MSSSNSAAAPGASWTPQASAAASTWRRAPTSTPPCARRPRSKRPRSPSCSWPWTRCSASRTCASCSWPSNPAAPWCWRSTSGTCSTTNAARYLEREIEQDLAHVAWAPRVNISAKTGWHKDRLVPALDTGAGELGQAHPHRPPQRVPGRTGGRAPAPGPRRQAAPHPVRHPGLQPAAEVRALHHRVPGSRLPPLHHPPAAGNLRLRGHARSRSTCACAKSAARSVNCDTTGRRWHGKCHRHPPGSCKLFQVVRPDCWMKIFGYIEAENGRTNGL